MRFPNIAAERARLGLSMEDLAQRLEVTRKTLYNWEQSGVVPPDKAEKMAEMFGVSTEYLLKEDSA